MKYIMVDIDGTVADCEHRVKYVQTKPSNWKAFNRAAEFDRPIAQVVDMVLRFREDYMVVFCSGRSDDMRDMTEKWIEQHMSGIGSYDLYMRKTGDYRGDDIVKAELYARIYEEYGNSKPYFVLDDRPRVINVWKKLGLFVFDVSNGRWDGVEND